MAKLYRTIKFSYDTTTESVDIPTKNETVERNDLQTIRQSIDGTRYSFITGYRRVYSYSFEYISEELYDFFFDAFSAFKDNFVVTFEREKDDGTFESMEVIVKRPQYSDDSIGTTEKVYSNVSCEVLEI